MSEFKVGDVVKARDGHWGHYYTYGGELIPGPKKGERLTITSISPNGSFIRFGGASSGYPTEDFVRVDSPQPRFRGGDRVLYAQEWLSEWDIRQMQRVVAGPESDPGRLRFLEGDFAVRYESGGWDSEDGLELVEPYLGVAVESCDTGDTVEVRLAGTRIEFANGSVIETKARSCGEYIPPGLCVMCLANPTRQCNCTGQQDSCKVPELREPDLYEWASSRGWDCCQKEHHSFFVREGKMVFKSTMQEWRDTGYL